MNIPAPRQFTAAVAEELLILIGPRRLISLLQRIQRQGPWRETIKIYKEFKSNDGKITVKKIKVGKYEHELREQQRIQKSGLDRKNYRLGDTGMIASNERIDELLVLMSPGMAAKSDDEIASVINQWIEGERSKHLMIGQLSEDQLEEYERTFKPRDLRLSKTI